MASVADVCSEMADVQVMLQSDSYAEAVKRKLVTGLATKIVGMKDVDVSAAHQIMTGIKSMSICPELSGVLEKAINDRLLKTPGPKAKSAQQLLSNGLSFLTQGDWVKIDDPQATAVVMSRVIQERVSKLGLRSFDEETYRWILAILLAKVIEKTGQWPKYEQVHQWLLQWKRDYTTLKTPWPFDVIVTYPPSPSMLPADVYSYAYSPSDPPITKEIANFQALATHHIPLRKNSNLLVREAEATARLTGLSLFGSAMPQPSMHPGGMQGMQRDFMQFLQAQQRNQVPIPDMQYFGAQSKPQQPSSQGRPALSSDESLGGGGQIEVASDASASHTAFGGQQSQGALQFRIGTPKGVRVFSSPVGSPGDATKDEPKDAKHDAKADAKDDATDDAKADAKDDAKDDARVDPSESIELATFAALKARTVKKKPAAPTAPLALADKDGTDDDSESSGGEPAKPSAPTKKTSPVLKRPVLKRPSSTPLPASVRKVKPVTVDYKLPEVNKSVVEQMNWHNFGSKVYHESKGKAVAAGHPDPSGFARDCFAKAGVQYVAAGGKKTLKA
jgi:hypothetical protein